MTVITASSGVVFKTVGDAIYAAFASALDAVRAAVDGQQAVAAEPLDTRTPLQVRMALHSGVVEARDGDYFGLPLSRIARLLAAGHGGQILLSQTTQELVRLIDIDRGPRRAPDRPNRLCCRWISDGKGRLVCVWGLAPGPATFRPGR